MKCSKWSTTVVVVVVVVVIVVVVVVVVVVAAALAAAVNFKSLFFLSAMGITICASSGSNQNLLTVYQRLGRNVKLNTSE